MSAPMLESGDAVTIDNLMRARGIAEPVTLYTRAELDALARRTARQARGGAVLRWYVEVRNTGTRLAIELRKGGELYVRL